MLGQALEVCVEREHCQSMTDQYFRYILFHKRFSSEGKHSQINTQNTHDKFEYNDKCEKSTAISNNLTTAIGYVDWILLVEDVQKVASLPSHFRLFSFVLTMANNAEWITSVHLHKTRRRRRRKQLCDVGRCLSKGQRDGRTFGRRPRIQREGEREVGRGANLAGFSY